MLTRFENIAIKGIVCAVPKRIIQLEELKNIFGKSEVNKIIRATGIESLRVAEENKTASDYGLEAALFLFKEMKILPQNIETIIFVSQTPDYITPATSKVLQHKLRLSNDTLAIDINEGCNGFIVGLYLGHLLLSQPNYKRVLVIVGDTLSKSVNQYDKSLRMVLGDAVCAALIEKEEDFPASVFELKNDGSNYEKLIIPAGGARSPCDEKLKSKSIEDNDGNKRSLCDLHMDGVGIMNFSLREVPQIVKSVLSATNKSLSDIDVFIFHQANEFIINYIGKILKLEKDKVPTVVDGYGNTSGCSIPLVIAKKYKEFEKQNRLKNVLLAGFGVGLSWGATFLSLERLKYVNIVEV